MYYTMVTNSKYTNIAFISYKREDEAWAKWLQKKLEHYKLPTEIRKKNPDLEFSEHPRHVFKDTTDLSGGVLAKAINEGLGSSKFLIVICSPRAAKSEWVCKEVQKFIDSGREEYIIPFIIEGEPHAKNIEKECFPSTLKTLAGERELLGINVNENGREAASVKVAARMFGLSFDSLWQRFKKEESQKRKDMLRIFSIFVSVAFLFPLLIAGSYFSTGSGFHSPMSEYIGKSYVDTIEMTKDSLYRGNRYADTIVIMHNKNHNITIDRCQDVKTIIINSGSNPNETINNIHIYNCNALNEIRVNARIRRIDWPFVDNCPSLKRIVLPCQLKEVRADAIHNCYLTDILFSGDNNNFVWKENCLWDVFAKKIVYANFTKVKRLERSDVFKDKRFERENGKVSLYVPFPKEIENACSEIVYDSIHVRNTNNSQYAVRYGILYNNTDINAEEISLSNSIREIKIGAFRNCKKLKKLIINDRIEIGNDAFKDNTSLESLEINAGSGNVTICKSAFEGAKALSKVVIKSADFVRIDPMSFWNCKKLRKIEIDCNTLKIDNYALQDCYNLKTLYAKFKEDIQLTHYITNFDNCLSYQIKNDSIKIVKCKNGNYFFYMNKFLCHDGNIRNHTSINKNDSIPYYSEDGFLKYRDGSLTCIPLCEIKKPSSILQKYRNNSFCPGRNMAVIYKKPTDTKLYLPPIVTEKYFLSSAPKNLRELHIPVISPSHVLISDIMEYIGDDCILYVPYGTSKAYQEDGRYYAFKEIREDSLITRILNTMLYQYYTGKLFVKLIVHDTVLLVSLFMLFVFYMAYCYYKFKKWKISFRISPKKSILIILSIIFSSMLITTIMIVVWFITYWGIYSNIFINEGMRIFLSNLIAAPFSYILISFVFTGEINIFKYGYFEIKSIIIAKYKCITCLGNKR